MLKREITFETFEGETVTKVYYFNMSKSELLELDSGGMEALLRQIIEQQDKEELIKLFKKIILMSYGERDGDAFLKSEALSHRFSQTMAYDKLFMELATDDNAASTFMLGILPPDVAQQARDQDKPLGPPKTSPVVPPPPAEGLVTQQHVDAMQGDPS